MKRENLLLLGSFFGIIILLAGLRLTNAQEESINAVFNTESSSDLAEITDDISASDIVEAEDEVEAEKIRYTNRSVSKGSGWIITDQKGALLQIHLVSGYSNSNISNNSIISKGWLKAGKLKMKLESTDNTASRKVFDVSAGDGSVSGTLILNREAAYQNGFAVWGGELTLKVGTNRSFDAKVNLAIEEKQIGKGKLKEQKERSESSYAGTLKLGDLSYELNGKANSNLRKIELDVKSSNAKGKMVLEKTTANEYIGKLKIESRDADTQKLSGKITATLALEGNTLSGPVTFTGEDESTLDGTIRLTLNKRESNSSDDEDDLDEDNGSKSREKEDRRGSNSGTSNRGFWKRFVEFFGG